MKPSPLTAGRARPVARPSAPGRPGRRAVRLGRLCATLAIAAAVPWPAQAQGQEGGLYITGHGFDFAKTAQQAMAQNPAGRRFFLLALPPNTEALTRRASRSAVTARDQVVARGGVLLVCQRDIDSGAVRAADLVPGVTVARSFPPAGGADVRAGERYLPGEDASRLPQSDTALRRLRSACS